MASIMGTYEEEMEDILKEMEGLQDKDKLDELLTEAEKLLGRMKIQVHSLPKDSKEKAQMKIANYNKTLSAKRKDLLFVAGSASAGAGGNAFDTTSEDDANARAQAMLEESLRKLHESERTGAATLEELDKQKSTIKGTNDKLKTINSDLKTSNGLLTKMGKWWRG